MVQFHLEKAGKPAWVVIDGGDTNRFSRRRNVRSGALAVGRLPDDAAIRDLPPQAKECELRRGRKRNYGVHRISLAKLVGQREEWWIIECTIYGEFTTKKSKRFLAIQTQKSGPIRVAIVQKDHPWHAFVRTRPDATVVVILEAFAERATNDQDFHFVKVDGGTGQQQVRNL